MCFAYVTIRGKSGPAYNPFVLAEKAINVCEIC